MLELEEGTRFQVLAPVVRGRKGEYTELLRELQVKGYSRARVDGTVIRLETAVSGDLPALKKYEKHDIEVVVDRLDVKESARRRLTDSVETALVLSGGVVVLDFVDLPEDDPQRERMFSEHLACLYDDLSFDELEPRSFSFNSPWGACPDCTGLGTRMEVDPELVVSDPDLTLAEGAIAVWSGGHVSDYFIRLIEALGDALGFSIDTPWAAAARGGPQGAAARLRRAGARPVQEPVRPGALVLHATSRARSRTSSGGTPRRRATPAGSGSPGSCARCRARPARAPGSSRCRWRSRWTAGRSRTTARCRSASWPSCCSTLELSDRDKQIAGRILKEVNARLGFLLDVGLDYLTLDRASATLAGGEAQRIRLATQIGSGLVGVLYVLDEPSIGLHQRDNHRLLETLLRLRDLGNTLIVVEHDEDTIRAADWVVDIGPRAGEHGGHVVVSGPVEELLASEESLTGAYLTGRKEIPLPAQRRKRTRGKEVAVKGASANNLRDVDVAFPLGVFVAVTGVSGSGKSTLVNDILYSALARELNGARIVPGKHTRVTGHAAPGQGRARRPGADRPDAAVQPGHLHRGLRPRPEAVRADHRGQGARLPAGPVLLQRQGRAVRGLRRGRHDQDRDAVPAGRLRAVRGLSRRPVQPDTLQVHYKGKTIADVLQMPIEEAAEFFEPVPAIHRHLKTLVDVGLGYVRLGQPAPTLSGGEAQRVKLATELQRRSTGRTIYVLDEPTTGLHFDDIRKLLGVLGRLVDGGNTVIVIEHNLDVIKTADWVIDLGPEGGSRGGAVIATGTPEQVAKVEESYTGQFLAKML